MHDHEPEDHDLGLQHDLVRILDRRAALGLLGGASLAVLAGCGSEDSPSTSDSAAPAASESESSASSSASAASVDCADGEIPEETAGPYPGDGSNGPNALTESGVVRSDITRSFGSASGVAEGVPLTVKLTVVDVSAACAPLAGAAVYLWHCDREGEYSMYGQGITDENYLRGVQETAADGTVTFTSIFPACYSGRWPHIHFEVYASLDEATSAGSKLRTSQLALPQDVCDEVYATDGYSASVGNLAAVSLQSDNVFSDGYSLQMATVSGDVSGGYTATLGVPV